MKYVAYNEYKPSGTEWLGSLPTHWSTSPLKYAADIKTGYAFSSDDFTDEGTPVLRISDITKEGKVDLSNAKFLPTEYASAFEAVTLKSGDIVMAMTGATIGKVGRYAYEIPSVLNQRVCSFEAIKNNDQKFLWYILNSDFYIKHIALTAFGGAQPNISDTQLLACDAPVPPLDEQKTIAHFLDTKTAQIDDLIAKKRQLIDKLKEKRSALIARTVTRGLPPEAAKAAGLEENPEMRDSRVEWLGQIPKNWASVPLSYLVKIRGGATPDKGKPEYWDGNIPWVSPKDMKIPRIFDTEDHISEEGLFNSPLSLAPTSSLLIVVRGMILAHSFPVAISMLELTINQDMKALVCSNRVKAEYLYWVLCGFSSSLVALADESAHGTKKIESSTLKRFPILVPPLAEQQIIANYLDHETAQLDVLAANVESAITRLTEYRQALITSAVTGKIDVRGLA